MLFRNLPHQRDFPREIPLVGEISEEHFFLPFFFRFFFVPDPEREKKEKKREQKTKKKCDWLYKWLQKC